MRRSRMYDIRFMQSLFPAAEAEAAAMGEGEPGAEHLILASLEFQEGSVRRTFERVGADPDQFRVAIVAQHDEALRAGAMDDLGISDPLPPPTGRPAGVYRSAPSAREVFPEVVKLVKRDKSRLSAAVAQGARSITPPGRGVWALIHGTTVATNALLEHKGARTVLVTDAGFEDVIQIARQDRIVL